MRLDEQNGNNNWKDCTSLEMKQIMDYSTFDIGEKAALNAQGKIKNAPAGYQQGRVHLVYDIKHDGRHKAQLVLDGHLTEVPLDSVYSSVVSL